MRAVIYRKEADQRTGYEVENQISEFAIRNGYEVLKSLVECGSTREMFNKMLCLIREQEAEYLLVNQVEDISREPIELGERIRALGEAGIKGIVQTTDGSILDGHFLNNQFGREITSVFDEAEIFNPLYRVKGMRVAIYHLSLDPIRKGCIDLNMNILRSFANRKNWTIAKEYIELTNLKAKKEKEKQLLEEAEEFDIVLVKNAYYFSRETSSFLKIRNELLKKGVRIYSINEGWC